MLNTIYNNSPVFFQNFMMSVYGYYWKNRRYGKGFLKEVEKARLRESFSYKQWKEYQTLELRKLLNHSFEYVPFYNKSFTAAGFNKTDLQNLNLDDIKHLPFLEKNDLRLFGKTTLIATNKEKGDFYSSSGSTGTPTNIYLSPSSHRKWNALYETRVRNWAGVNYKMARGMIGGRLIIDKNNTTPPFYRYNAAEKQTYFSAFHINRQNVKNYVHGIINNKVEYMVGYANSIFYLADFIVKENLRPKGVKAVLTSSEKLTNEMRFIIEKAFACKVYDAYSGVEACGLISEDSFGELLFSPDSGILELLDEKGNEVSNGEVGEIVSTGFLNYNQPLIRYRIGDLAKKSTNQKTKSSKSMLKIDEITGRTEDTVVAPDGSKLVRFHGIFIDITGVVTGQVIQETLIDFKINLVVDTNYNKSNEKLMIKRMKERLGNDISVVFSIVDSIPRENNGKFKAVISKVK